MEGLKFNIILQHPVAHHFRVNVLCANLSQNFKTLYYGSAVGIATGYWLDDLEVGIRVPIGSRIFTKSSISFLGLTSLLSIG
jgi:hypothetical protein